jgi:chromosome segregation ATPase
MDRHGIPKGEKPSVTIANLERENDMLVRRVCELRNKNSDLDREVRELKTDIESANHIMRGYRTELETSQAKVAKLESILCGYRQAIADVHHTNVEMVQP